MKKFILLATMLLVGAFVAGAQTTKVSDKVAREGNTFIQQTTRGASAVSSNDQETSYTWRDSKGNEYPIILHTYTKGEKAGKETCYVWKVSAKTGKKYKYYIPNGEAIAEQIIKENL